MMTNRVQQFLTPERRKLLARFWVVGVLFYDAVRAFIISETLSHHGVNGVWYFAFELSISIPYALCSLRLILAIVDHKMTNIYIYGLGTLVLFFSPDIYVFVVSHSLTMKIYLIYGSVLTTTTTITLLGITREVRKKRGPSAKALG